MRICKMMCALSESVRRALWLRTRETAVRQAVHATTHAARTTATAPAYLPPACGARPRGAILARSARLLTKSTADFALSFFFSGARGALAPMALGRPHLFVTSCEAGDTARVCIHVYVVYSISSWLASLCPDPAEATQVPQSHLRGIFRST